MCRRWRVSKFHIIYYVFALTECYLCAKNVTLTSWHMFLISGTSTISLWSRHYYLFFTREKTEAQRSHCKLKQTVLCTHVHTYIHTGDTQNQRNPFKVYAKCCGDCEGNMLFALPKGLETFVSNTTITWGKRRPCGDLKGRQKESRKASQKRTWLLRCLKEASRRKSHVNHLLGETLCACAHYHLLFFKSEQF